MRTESVPVVVESSLSRRFRRLADDPSRLTGVLRNSIEQLLAVQWPAHGLALQRVSSQPARQPARLQELAARVRGLRVRMTVALQQLDWYSIQALSP